MKAGNEEEAENEKLALEEHIHYENS